MASDLRPGPASIAGLRWLSRVGPSPLDAWRHAMGWGPVAARRHARRLEEQRWLERHRMTRGDGSLFVASRQGVRISGLAVSAAAAPSPTLWAHDCACAWTAAWFTVRGADWQGPREVLADPDLKGDLEWQTRSGWRRTAHRPDLTVLAADGPIAVEVELQRKAEKRLGAVLSLYRRWLDESRIAGVVYVCANDNIADRVRRHGVDAGLPTRAIRIELLDAVREQASGVPA